MYISNMEFLELNLSWWPVFVRFFISLSKENLDGKRAEIYSGIYLLTLPIGTCQSHHQATKTFF